MLSLASLLEDGARRHADRVAVVSENRRWTYGELDEAANRVAHMLVARGVEPTDRVALTCPNGAAFAIAHFGILKTGAASVPLNILLAEREIAYHLDNSGARVYLCHADTPELSLAAAGAAGFAQSSVGEHLIYLDLDGSAYGAAGHGASESRSGDPQFDGGFRTHQAQETDTAVVLYTSGTTGQPKGAELTHSNLVMNAVTGCRSYGIVADDVFLAGVPLSHATGLTMMLHMPLAAGSSLVMMPRYRPVKALELMRDEQVSVFVGVPTMYQTLLDAAKSSPELTGCAEKAAERLRLSLVGGASASPHLISGFEKLFGVQLLEGYGLSETSPIAIINRPGLPRRAGSVGTAVWGVEVGIRLIDGGTADQGESGEVVVRGHNIMKGYLGNPEATRQAIDEQGWFYTGDLGQVDADGYLTIIGRKKEMIIRGGFNVYPRELEELLVTHPDVADAAVVGIPHDIHGEEVKAFVVRAPGSVITETELIDWCRGVMAAYKYPRFVEFLDHLPTTSTGKVLRSELISPSRKP
jgi:long-chain acyl-CoA synthetase